MEWGIEKFNILFLYYFWVVSSLVNSKERLKFKRLFLCYFVIGEIIMEIVVL